MMREFFELLFLNFTTGAKNFWEFWRVLFKYYYNLRFAKCDLTLLLCYLFRSPFRASKTYWTKQGANDVYVYGETPLTTLDTIVSECKINKNDVVFELGCGRGRTCFWLNQYHECQVIAVEIIPEFIDKAKRVQWFYRCKGIEFRCEDMLKTDIQQADVVYLYGSNFDDTFLNKLVKKLSGLKPGAKVITVSYPITDFANDSTFEVMKRFPVKFPWGEADVFLQVRK